MGIKYENEYFEVIDKKTGEVIYIETDYGNAAEHSQAMCECDVDTEVVVREGIAKVVDGRYAGSPVGT
jgi:hypothetical protein